MEPITLLLERVGMGVAFQPIVEFAKSAPCEGFGRTVHRVCLLANSPRRGKNYRDASRLENPNLT